MPMRGLHAKTCLHSTVSLQRPLTPLLNIIAEEFVVELDRVHRKSVSMKADFPLFADGRI